MRTPKVLIIGGGLAGLSAGCYALASGLRVQIVEHNLALGGVCTAWQRGRYTIDGCIHWLTGGPFQQLYQELGIVPPVALKTIERFEVYRHLEDSIEVELTRDLAALGRSLKAIAPDDAEEIDRLMAAAAEFDAMRPPIDKPQELWTLRDALAALWEMRHHAETLVRYRKPVAAWTAEHLQSPRLRRLLTRLYPPGSPMMLVLFQLGYLAKGFLSRPVGGTARFRDALVESFHQLGGEAQCHATVDEVLVEGGRAIGVRLADGSMLEADHIISTSSGPETVLRLLGGRYGGDEMRERQEKWKTFDPIVLASFGVERPLDEVPQLLAIDGIPPLMVGGRSNESLYLRVCNDDPSFAPPGHSVVQAMVSTSYEWWASRGTRYHAEKEAAAEAIVRAVEQALPGVKSAVRVVDVATPLTYWNMARSWRGAYEGWLPSDVAFFSHVRKTLPGLGHFYMAGQWVEPGGGVPMAVMSGRQAVHLLCSEHDLPFRVPRPAAQP
jgi:phytoene dehydrogenase-like protein